MSTNAQVAYRIPPPGYFPASIEIGESFALAWTALNQTITKIFRYTSGAMPTADAFTFTAYTSQSDANKRVNPLSASDVAAFLEYYFIPETPAEGAENEMGYLVATLIESPDYEELYGVICIEQEDPDYEKEKHQSVTPLELNRRPHIPTWEIR